MSPIAMTDVGLHGPRPYGSYPPPFDAPAESGPPPDFIDTSQQAAAPVPDGQTSTLAFLQKVLPEIGLYIIARYTDKGWRHQVCDTIEEAAHYAVEYDRQGVATYHACAAYGSRAVEVTGKDGKATKRTRVQSNVRALKAFWMDLDVGETEGKYESQLDAATSALDFCSAHDIPNPTVVSSGWGVHVYWTLTDEIGLSQWQPTADALKALAAHHGLRADPACTADAARILRPVGTTNRKRAGEARPVTLAHDAEPTVPAEFQGRVAKALAATNIALPMRTNCLEKTERLNEDFAVRHDYPPFSAVRAAERCQQLAKVASTRGNVPEPLWYAALQLVVNAKEGDALGHQWSDGYPGYSHGETARKLDQARAFGPPFCKTFADRNPGGCDGCPHRVNISTPAQLGVESENRVAPSVVAQSPLVLINPFGNATQDYAAVLAAVMHAPTEDGVAHLFEARYGNDLRYCKQWGSWLVWDGTRWKADKTDRAFDFSRLLAREANHKRLTSVSKAAFASGVERFARASRHFATESCDWDRDEHLLNTPDGTIDLRTGETRPQDRQDMITNVTSVSPKFGPRPVFDKFMRGITLADESLIEYHQRSLGATLSGARADHWLLFWIGEGRNGKNTLGDLIKWILNDYAKAIPSETLMSAKSQGHPTEIASLRGIRLAISSEVAEGAYWNEARIKSLTGDATISARFMRQDFFEFERSHKHLIYGNHRPMLRVVDDAIRARMHMVPFRARFDDELGNRDPMLPEKLRNEAPQILAWLVEGHQKWAADGYALKPCAAVSRETAEYLETQSTPAMWLSERCEILNPDERPTKDLPKSDVLYKDFVEFKKRRGEQPASQTRWGEWIAGKFQKVKSNGNRYRGLRLRPLDGDTMEWVIATRPAENLHSSSA